MEELSPKEGRVGAAEDRERLHNSNVLREPGSDCQLLGWIISQNRHHRVKSIYSLPCDGAAEDAVKKSKESSSESNGEEGEDSHEDVVAVDAPGEGGEGVHGVVEDDADTVVEERLAKDKEVEAGIDLEKVNTKNT